MSIPILDLSKADHFGRRNALLHDLRSALFDVGFLYITNHGVPDKTISDLANRLPVLFELPDSVKRRLSKLHSPHFLGYSGFAEETTLGKHDLREQYDFATELPAVHKDCHEEHDSKRDFSELYWRLRGPNQWPTENELPGFRAAFEQYHDELSNLSYRFVHLIEEAFGITIGTFDGFFGLETPSSPSEGKAFLSPQHRIKLLKYPVCTQDVDESQGVGPHKDSSGWLTFLYQVGAEKGLEVLDKHGNWISAVPIPGTFVVNFGNAFEAATEGAVRATVHRVKAPTQRDRYSIPFFMGLPLDLTISKIRSYIPQFVRSMRRNQDGESAAEAAVSSFLDPRWDSLGESQLRKWIRSHKDVALRWYGSDVVQYYTE